MKSDELGVQDDDDAIKCVLLDIEGTTTPISFVKDVLFVYVRNNLKTYLEKYWEDDGCQKDVQALNNQFQQDLERKESKETPIVPSRLLLDENEDAESVRQSVVDYVFGLMDNDRKVTALKQLQGHMWKNAYANGEVVGEIYKDVLPAIQRWVIKGKSVYIYSSGSIEAQKLLFGHTTEGDILKYISGHFDTKVGPKVDKESYCKIARQIKLETKEILFLTDVTREARPAKEAGCQVAVVIRSGNAPLSDNELKEFKHISSFSELHEEPAEKKRRYDFERDGEKV